MVHFVAQRRIYMRWYRFVIAQPQVTRFIHFAATIYKGGGVGYDNQLRLLSRTNYSPARFSVGTVDMRLTQ